LLSLSEGVVSFGSYREYTREPLFDLQAKVSWLSLWEEVVFVALLSSLSERVSFST
jgi:hypothetical protein